MKAIYLALVLLLVLLLVSCRLMPTSTTTVTEETEESEETDSDKEIESSDPGTGGVIDKSDKNAPKTIKSKAIISFKSHFIYAEKTGGYNRYDLSAEKKENGKTELIWTDEGQEIKSEVEAEFMIRLQELIDKHKLASKNGTNRFTSGLPYPYEPCHLHCEYESGEKINFYDDDAPESLWMGDIKKLFASELVAQNLLPAELLEPGITRFYYRHSGMMLPDIYDFEFEKNGEDSFLIANLFDPANSYEAVQAYWEGGEHSAFLEHVYERLVEIYDSYDIASWNGFSKSDNSARDGFMFNLSIEFANWSSVNAYGNNASPPGFHGAQKELKKLVDEMMAYYGEVEGE